MIIYDFKKISRSRRKYLWRCRQKVFKKLYKPSPEFSRVLQEQADRITGIIRAGYEPTHWDFSAYDAALDIATLVALSAEALVVFDQYK